MAFNFNPVDGLLNTSQFPSTPVNETAARQQFQTLLSQIKDFLNNNKLDEFAKSLSPNGYQKLPSGLIIQWGSVTIPANSNGSFMFPIQFPNSCFVVNVQNTYLIKRTIFHSVANTKAEANIYPWDSATNAMPTADSKVFIIAIGF